MSLGFPHNKRFAFSILDDTDDATVENVKPVYDRLRQFGFRTTKTAWPFDCPEGSRHFFAAQTLDNKAYRDFVHDLVTEGFELAFHGATMESSRRERTVQAVEFFKNEFGHIPRLFCNHGQNRENMYWGPKRFQTSLLRYIVRLVRRETLNSYLGEVEGSEYFWGDVCKEYIQFVRGFTFSRLNMLEVNPEMPYRLPETRYVNYWFSTANAPNVHAFNRLLSYDEIDKLEHDGGVCIISTHLGKGFVRNGKVDAQTANILEYLANKSGWFVPVSNILDYLLARNQSSKLGYYRRLRLECRFVVDKLIGLRRIR